MLRCLRGLDFHLYTSSTFHLQVKKKSKKQKHEVITYPSTHASLCVHILPYELSCISDVLLCCNLFWINDRFSTLELNRFSPHLFSNGPRLLQQLNCNNTALSQRILIIMIINDYGKSPGYDHFTYAARTSANMLWHLINTCLFQPNVFPSRDYHFLPFILFYFFFLFSCQQCI